MYACANTLFGPACAHERHATCSKTANTTTMSTTTNVVHTAPTGVMPGVMQAPGPDTAVGKFSRNTLANALRTFRATECAAAG